MLLTVWGKSTGEEIWARLGGNLFKIILVIGTDWQWVRDLNTVKMHYHIDVSYKEDRVSAATNLSNLLSHEYICVVFKWRNSQYQITWRHAKDIQYTYTFIIWCIKIQLLCPSQSHAKVLLLSNWLPIANMFYVYVMFWLGTQIIWDYVF